MEYSLKSIIINAVDEVYIGELRNKYTGYLGITARNLLDHLLNRYGKITPADVEECKKKMNDTINATHPIDIYFKRIDDTVQYAANGNFAFTMEPARIGVANLVLIKTGFISSSSSPLNITISRSKTR